MSAVSSRATAEVLVPFPEGYDTTTATHVRSTLLASSVHAMRERGLFQRYLEHLSEEARDPVLNTLAASWLPMDIGLLHYQAVDALALDDATVVEMGRAVGTRMQGGLLGTIVRGAKIAGASPWSVLSKLDRFWTRAFRGGGGLAVFRGGPKEARVDLRGIPLARCAYLRGAFRGAFAAGLEPVCRRVYVNVSHPPLSDRVVFELSWA